MHSRCNRRYMRQDDSGGPATRLFHSRCYPTVINFDACKEKMTTEYDKASISREIAPSIYVRHACNRGKVHRFALARNSLPINPFDMWCSCEDDNASCTRASWKYYESKLEKYCNKSKNVSAFNSIWMENRKRIYLVYDKSLGYYKILYNNKSIENNFV